MHARTYCAASHECGRMDGRHEDTRKHTASGSNKIHLCIVGISCICYYCIDYKRFDPGSPELRFQTSFIFRISDHKSPQPQERIRQLCLLVLQDRSFAVGIVHFNIKRDLLKVLDLELQLKLSSKARTKSFTWTTKLTDAL